MNITSLEKNIPMNITSLYNCIYCCWHLEIGYFSKRKNSLKFYLNQINLFKPTCETTKFGNV